jgi:hypothetical protein
VLELIDARSLRNDLLVRYAEQQLPRKSSAPWAAETDFDKSHGGLFGFAHNAISVSAGRVVDKPDIRYRVYQSIRPPIADSLGVAHKG